MALPAAIESGLLKKKQISFVLKDPYYFSTDY